MNAAAIIVRAPAGVVVAVLCLFPLLFSDFVTSTIGVRSLFLGIAAASITYLVLHAGMISFSQTALYGIAGFTMANLAAASGGIEHIHILGLDLGESWGPWQAAGAGVAVATVIGVAFGFVCRASYGIYFLMLTLALAVLTFYFFGQVPQLSGFGGIGNVPRPHLIGNPVTDPTPLYYVALAGAVGIYALFRSLVQTPFGLTLQGIRDDPIRMRSLGFRVELHRTLAFGLGAFAAAIAGILSVWYSGQVSPGSIDVIRTIDVFAIAVVGGLGRIEGAWLGAFAFTTLDYAVKRWVGDALGSALDGVTRFETWFGIIFLAILLVSPGGLVGLVQSLGRRIHVRVRRQRQMPDDLTGPAPRAIEERRQCTDEG